MQQVKGMREYFLGTGAVGLAGGLGIILLPWSSGLLTPLLLAAVLVTAWRGGFRPALWAAGLATLARYLLFFARDGTGFDWGDVSAGALFFLIGGSFGQLVNLRREQRTIFEMALRNIGDGVITTDNQGRVRFMNAAAEQLTGWPAAEASGQPLEAIFKTTNERLDPPGQAPIQPVLKPEKPMNRGSQSLLISRAAGEIPIQERLASLLEPSGKLRGRVIAFTNLIEQRQKQQVVAENEQLRLVINAAPALLSYIDTAYRYRLANQAYRRWFGQDSQEMKGRQVREVLGDAAWETVRPYLERALAGEQVTFEQQLSYRASGPRWVQAAYTPDFDPAGRVRGAIVLVHDVTERKHAEQKLARTNAELEHKLQEKSAKLREMTAELEHFSYSLTHDMRAPLRAMRGFADMLMAECGRSLNPESRGHLERIAASAERMDHLIVDALDYSKIVREEWPLKPVRTELLLRHIIESYPAFQQPKAQIEIVESLPDVLANEAGLTQCFSNLLNNAVKFVPPGTMPRVRVWAERVQRIEPRSRKFGFGSEVTPRKATHVRLWFEDNGIGIPKDCQARIFGMFQRVSKAYEGTGIGLALVRKAAERMGSTVGVESEAGQGSRFWIELPAAEEAPSLVIP